MTRDRSATRVAPGGNAVNYNTNGTVQSTPSQASYWIRETVVKDVIKKKKREKDKFPFVEVGLTPASDFFLDRIARHPSRMSGHTSNRGRNTVDFWTTTVSALVPALPIPSSAAILRQRRDFTHKLLAKTNPLTPEVSVPVMIAELVEVATLFKLAAGTFLSQVSGNYLNIQFGWKPFLSDLKALASITELVEKRAKQIASLGKQGGLRTRAFIHSEVVTNSLEPTGAIQSLTDGTIRGPIRRYTRYSVHGTCRWGFRGDPPDLTKLELFNRAAREVLDLEIPDPATVWEMIPFSWLIDYFVDVNSWLSASEGHLEIYPFDICLVYKGESRISAHPVTNIPSRLKVTPFTARRRTTQRFVVPWNRNLFPPQLQSWISATEQTNIVAILLPLVERLRTRR